MLYTFQDVRVVYRVDITVQADNLEEAKTKAKRRDIMEITNMEYAGMFDTEQLDWVGVFRE